MFLKELGYFQKNRKLEELVNVKITENEVQMGYHHDTIVKQKIGLGKETAEFSLEHSMANKLKDNYTKITYDNQNLELKLNTEDFEANVKAENFEVTGRLQIVEGKTKQEVEVNRLELLDKIDKIKPLMLKDDDPLSKNIAGVYWDFRSGNLTLVASDSYKLGLAEFKELPPSDNEAEGYIMNYRSVEILQKILKDNKGVEKVKIKIVEDKFKIYVKNTLLQSQIIDAKYPSYLEIVGRINTDLSFGFPTKPFEKLLTKAKQFFAGSTLIFEKDENGQSVYIRGNQGSTIKPKFDVKNLTGTKENIKLGFGPEQVKTVISKIQEDSFVWTYTGEINPSKIFAENDVYYIVMPTRF